jgi:HPt (histidine-containing phosphotransfer) domain-containing protein
MNITTLAAEIGLEETEYLELLDLFIRATESDLDEIRAADRARDAGRAARAAHSIKGAAANLGLPEISEEARLIEERGRRGGLDGIDAALRSLEARLADLKERCKR